MNYELTSDQVSLQQRYREFCIKEILPGAEMLDAAPRKEAEELLRKNIESLGTLGFLGLGINPEYGGTETDL
ncbi:MAG TPA: acyl-CoA dehydrogenase family protein, partial [Spirochaetota bacterium]|nr:acyl-CoA dehydrogenase family protein [Spirochaetota bacterium]